MNINGFPLLSHFYGSSFLLSQHDENPHKENHISDGFKCDEYSAIYEKESIVPVECKALKCKHCKMIFAEKSLLVEHITSEHVRQNTVM